ncbi:MAG: exodeoxyribonuclease III [Polyangiaceae bacterium]
MNVVTWNVNGIRAREAQFVEWIQREQPDVVCLQELKATPDQLSAALAELPGYASYWHGGPKGYSGVSIHCRVASFSEKPQFTIPALDVEHRAVEVRLPDHLIVTSLYVPNGGKDYGAKLQFLETMRGYVDTLHASGARLLVCGDMNVARSDIDVYPNQRKADVIGQRPDERALFERVLDTELVDVARTLDPGNDRLFTWWPPWRGLRQKNHGWRLDYVLASRGRGLQAATCRVLTEVGTSDHAPVLATFV